MLSYARFGFDVLFSVVTCYLVFCLFFFCGVALFFSFCFKIGVLLKSKLPGKMISAMNLGDEATKLAEDVHWGSRSARGMLILLLVSLLL